MPRLWDQTLSQKLLRRLKGLPKGVRELERALSLLSVFKSLGWTRSAALGMPVDAEGKPLPWLTYPALQWLDRYARSTHVVYEFGAGHSTLWFAGRVSRVHAIDHDPAWVARLQGRLPPNAHLTLGVPGGREASDTMTSLYVRSVLAFPDHSFDIIVIDGVERSGCAKVSPSKLKPDGVILFDNSDRPEHRAALTQLREQGFARVDLIGHTPGYWHLSCTSVLFRSLTPFLRDDPPEYLGF